MEIRSVHFSKTKKTFKGYIKVKNDNRIVKVEFDYDFRHESWNQWGASENVLCFTQPIVERLVSEYIDNNSEHFLDEY